jgi:hypothetical protein
VVLTKECSSRPRLGEVVAIYLKDPLFYDLIDRFTQNGGRDKFTPEDLRVLGGYVSSSPEIASLLSEVLNSAQLPQESRQHREPIMLSRPILVLTTVAAIGSCVLSTSAFTQGPPPPPGIGGPPLGGPPPGGPPGAGPPAAGLPHGGPPGGGPSGGGNLGGRIAAGNVGSSLRGVSGGARFSGRNTFNSSSSYSAGSAASHSGSDYGRRGRYGYYGAAAAGAAAGYAYGSAYGDQSYTYSDESCYRTVRYQTRSGWHQRVVYVCE